MRKPAAALLAIALGIALIALPGCKLLANPLDDANAAIEAGNVHLRAYDASEDKVQKVATELNSLNATTAADAAQALTYVGQLKAELATQKKALQSAADEIGKVGTFDVDASFKKYAELEVAALKAQIAVVEAGEKYYAEMERHYTALKDGKSEQKLTAEILKNIDTLSQTITDLSKTASDAKDAADAQFEITSKEK